MEIDKPGYYLINFSSTGYNTGASSTVDSSDGTYSFQLFNNGVNFYRNQMDILHFFNIFFLTEIMLNRKSTKRTNILNQTIEIPI